MMGWDDALLIAGMTAAAGAGSYAASRAGGGGGASAADQVNYWDKMHMPMRDQEGSFKDEDGNYYPSRAAIENQLEIEQYQKQLGASAESNLAFNTALNRMQPTAIRQGLEAAGYNPILGVLGNYNGSNSTISAPGGQSVAQPTITRPMRGLNSSVSFDSLAKAVFGAYKASTDNTVADTDVKGAQVADVRAGAALKKAEADNIQAKTETEHALRSERVKQLENENAFGKSWFGDYGRAAKNGIDQLVDLGKQGFQSIQTLISTPDTSSAGSQSKLLDSKVVPVPVSTGDANSSKSAVGKERYLMESNRPRKPLVIPLIGTPGMY